MLKKTFILLLTASFLAVGCNSQQKDKTAQTGKDAYIQLYSVRSDIKNDFKGSIAAVAQAGYKGVEAAGYNDGKFYNLSPAEFKSEIENAGMTVLSSHTGISLADDISATDWDHVWQWWDQAIAAHKEAGMKYIVKPSMPTPKTLEGLKAYCDYYNQVGERCNAAGLKFGYHNHAFEFEKIEDEIMYDFMLKNTDADKVFFQMDVYWTVMGRKSPVDYFNEYPGRFLLLHLKDNKELGQSGMVGFDAILNNTDKAGTKYMIVEVEKYNFTPFESVKISYDYLNNNPLYKADYSK